MTVLLEYLDHCPMKVQEVACEVAWPLISPFTKKHLRIFIVDLSVDCGPFCNNYSRGCNPPWGGWFVMANGISQVLASYKTQK